MTTLQIGITVAVHAGYDTDALFAVLAVPRRAGNARIHPIPGRGAAVCGDGDAGGVLPKRRYAAVLSVWAAGADRRAGHGRAAPI